MKREEFMRELERLLRDIPENDRVDAIAYYNSYFDEAGEENEERVIRELGSPEKVAETIKADLNLSENGQNQYTEYEYSDWNKQKQRVSNVPDIQVPEGQKKSNTWKIVVIVLLVLASPMILGIGAGIIGCLVGILSAVLGILISIICCGAGLLVGGIVCFGVGVFRIAVNPAEGMMTAGTGALLTAAGILFVLLFMWIVGKWLPAFVKICVNGCKKIWSKSKRGNA